VTIFVEAAMKTESFRSVWEALEDDPLLPEPWSGDPIS
jgi:hypothetical protein